MDFTKSNKPPVFKINQKLARFTNRIGIFEPIIQNTEQKLIKETKKEPTGLNNDIRTLVTKFESRGRTKR